ncbi:hypothetical protein LIER_05949 [Lithospermum erythrorhizon]|uniref:Uncharacterized protein n=1 Tax=Lithospermum erythrorhizon TaxID=34254 RepID=A0AAV3P3E6_LITER
MVNKTIWSQEVRDLMIKNDPTTYRPPPPAVQNHPTPTPLQEPYPHLHRLDFPPPTLPRPSPPSHAPPPKPPYASPQSSNHKSSHPVR